MPGIALEKLLRLSDRQLAWTQLSINQLRQHVVNRPQLWVRRQSHIGASDSISVVRADRQLKSWPVLQVGREMLVKVVDKWRALPGRRVFTSLNPSPQGLC